MVRRSAVTAPVTPVSEAVAFLSALFATQTGVLELRTFGADGDAAPARKLRREANRLRDFVPVTSGRFDAVRVQQFIAGCNAAKLGAFFGVALRSRESLKDEKGDAAHCQTLTALFVDADDKHLGKDETRKRIAEAPLPPSIIAESGAGLHAYWVLKRPFYLKKEMAEAKRWLRHIASTVADVVDEAVSEPVRVLRLPGSVNFKYDPPQPVTLSLCTDVAYTLEEIQAAFGEPAKPEKSDNTAGSHFSVPETIPKGERHALLYRFLRSQKSRNVPLEVALAGCHALNNTKCDPPIGEKELDDYLRRVWSQENAEFKTDPYDLNDTGNSLLFATQNAARLRYDVRTRAWFLFGEHHWTEDTTKEVDRLALAAIRTRQKAAVGNEAASRWAARSLSRPSRDNLLKLAQSVRPLSVAGGEWDQDPWLLPVLNGTVPLKTGVLRPGVADDLITKVAPVAFDAGAECPRWRRFVSEIFVDNPELEKYMQRVAGYIITGITTEQCFFVLHGVGANGKTTFIETLRHVLGHDFCWSMPFPSASWSDSISEYQRAELVGRRLVVTSELSRQKELNAELVKSLTGSDRINARRVRERPFTFTPTAKFVLAVNDPPVIEDTSVGMWRRVKLIPFLQSFDTPDTTLGDALRAEAPGILTWAVEGCLEWQRDGLQHPECVTAATAEYRQESDPFQNFVAEHCITGPGYSAGATALFEAFSSQVPNKGMSQRAFGKRLRALSGVTAERGRYGVSYVGIGLLTNGDGDGRDGM